MTNPQSNIDEVRRKLSESATSFKPRIRSKQNALEPLADEIKALKEKGATNAEIAELITQSGLEVGKDTLRRFVAQLGITKTPKNRNPKPVKSGEKETKKTPQKPKTNAANTPVPKGFNPPPNISEL